METIDEIPFVTNKDINILQSNGINYKTDINLFLQQMRLFLNNVWPKEYYIETEIKTMDELNIYLDFPSENGYDIIINLFNKKDLPLEFFTIKSLIILKHFYSITIFDMYNSNEEVLDEGIY